MCDGSVKTELPNFCRFCLPTMLLDSQFHRSIHQGSEAPPFFQLHQLQSVNLSTLFSFLDPYSFQLSAQASLLLRFNRSVSQSYFSNYCLHLFLLCPSITDGDSLAGFSSAVPQFGVFIRGNGLDTAGLRQKCYSPG